MSIKLQITLLSDATFGRGDGVAGLVDEEIEYDAATGLPYLRGRALKGLLVEECANLLFALENHPKQNELKIAAKFLFGNAGSTDEDDAMMRVGDATVPQALQKTIRAMTEAENAVLTPADVLDSLTAIRRQTSIDDDGAPQEGSLRSMRVLLRCTVLVAPLSVQGEIGKTEKQLLAACAAAVHRGGVGRNRGRGRIKIELCENEKNITPDELNAFETWLGGM